MLRFIWEALYMSVSQFWKKSDLLGFTRLQVKIQEPLAQL
jgi:hypothetical protein